MKEIKNARKVKSYTITSLRGWGVQIYTWELQEIKVLIIYYNHIEIIYKKCKMDLFCLSKEVSLLKKIF